MPWLSAQDAAKALHIKGSALRERARKGKIRREGQKYLVGEDDTIPQPAPDALHIEHDDAGAYVYDEGRDKYIFALRSKANAGKPLVLQGDVVRSMVLAYSRDGETASLNALSRTYGLHRSSVREVLRALGKTHDSAPFSDEDIAKRDEGDLGEDLIRLKEERVMRAAERAQWDTTKKMAAKAVHFDRFVADRIKGIIDSGNMPALPIFNIVLPETPSDLSVLVGLTDLHFGAAGWKDETGTENNLELCRARAITTVEKLIARTMRFGRPARWVLPVGSDNFHADTDLGTTTKGTPLDMSGSFARQYLEGTALYETLVCMLAAVAPVMLRAMPGNHDRIASMMATHWLAARFHADDRVTVGHAAHQRTYDLFGRTLLGLNHGDTAKDEKLAAIMPVEVPELWGQSRHRILATGHLHTDKANEYSGVRVIHMPSLAPSDRWHWRNLYVGNTKACSAYLLDDREGLVATLPIQPPDQE